MKLVEPWPRPRNPPTGGSAVPRRLDPFSADDYIRHMQEQATGITITESAPLPRPRRPLDPGPQPLPEPPPPMGADRIDGGGADDGWWLAAAVSAWAAAALITLAWVFGW